MEHRIPPAPDWPALIKSGNRLFIGSVAAVPNALIDDLITQRQEFHDLEIIHSYTVSAQRWVEREFYNLFHTNTFFISDAKVRQAVAEGRADYTPCKQSEIETQFSNNTLPLDAALIMVSPPDEHGYCSLGVSVDITASAAEQARCVIAQINPLMPRTHGDTHIHLRDIAACIEQAQPLPESPPYQSNDVTERIGQYLAMLVDDGSTLHIGSGKASASVLKYLYNHRDLGIHSEWLSDGIMDLFNAGVINNSKKTIHKGKMVATFAYGSQELYDFVNENPHIKFCPSSHVESPAIIARNDNMVAINGAIEVDLTGQVVSDSLGFEFYSGIGGQADFIQGAALSHGGKPIIALPSTTRDGKTSRIVPSLTSGAGVVTTRGSVHYVVTEYGVAALNGKSIRERTLELIRVAHPKFRDQLLNEIRQHYWVPNYQLAAPVDVPEFEGLQVQTINIKGKNYNLRPLNPADERHLQAFFYSHTKETLRLRYNQHLNQMTREKSCNLVSVDQSEDLALCIVDQKGSAISIEAVGRFYKNAANNSAEVAFVTRETNHGKGMASRLLNVMIEVATKRGFDKLTAYVLKANKPMIRVFEKHGFQHTPHYDVQEVLLELPLKTELHADPVEPTTEKL